MVRGVAVGGRLVVHRPGVGEDALVRIELERQLPDALVGPAGSLDEEAAAARRGPARHRVERPGRRGGPAVRREVGDRVRRVVGDAAHEGGAGVLRVDDDVHHGPPDVPGSATITGLSSRVPPASVVESMTVSTVPSSVHFPLGAPPPAPPVPPVTTPLLVACVLVLTLVLVLVACDPVLVALALPPDPWGSSRTTALQEASEAAAGSAARESRTSERFIARSSRASTPPDKDRRRGPPYERARIRLFFAACSTSARPSASSTGGR